MSRERTAKRIAQRIDIGYYRRLHPFRRWKNWLAIGAPLLALLWVATLAASGREDAYSSGPVSQPHAVFGEACETCHLPQKGEFRAHVTDQACLACHDAPAHTPRQVTTPTCASCHLEHQGSVALSRIRDVSCAECHSDLKTRDGQPRIERVVDSFRGRHPEFAALKKPDPGKIRFNHNAHMKADLKSPDGSLAQVECADCHRPINVEAAWRFGKSEPNLVQTAAAPGSPVATRQPKPSEDLAGAFMAPVRYAQNCATCHNLQFDPRFIESAPHDKPQVIREFLVARFSDYIRKNPSELARPPQAPRRLPGREPVRFSAPRTPAEWVHQNVAAAEDLLYQKSCKHCHEVDFSQAVGALPTVAESQVPVRWMQHAVFDHRPHRMLDCDSCHNASASKTSADVMLPGIANCQTCHRGDGAAENGCFECHQYHRWTEEKRIKGRFRIEDLVSGRGVPSPQRAPGD